MANHKIGLVDLSLPENKLVSVLTENLYSFLDELLTRRIELGLSIEVIAEQIGVTPDAIKRLESFGDGNLFLLKCYAFALGANVGYTVSYEDHN